VRRLKKSSPGFRSIVDGNDLPLKRGDAITDRLCVLPAENGYVEFRRGPEKR